MKEKQVQFFAKSACRVFQDSDDKGQLWSLTLAVKDLPQGFPYGPNARNADLAAKPAKAMLETLRSQPQQFIYYNNGIMLVVGSLQARRVEGGDFEVRIKYTEPNEETEDFLGHGVLNGGHTYKVLMHALHGQHKRGEHYPDIHQAHVQVTVAVGIDEESVASISRARNLSKAVPDYALKNLEGDWQRIEKYLPSAYRKNVIFKPNEFEENPDESPKYTVVDLVQRLALLNNELFDFRKDSHPVAAYTGKGSLVSKWNDKNYEHVLPLLPDILWLEEKVMETHETLNGNGKGKISITRTSGCSKEKCTLITGRTFNLTVAPPFVMPVIAAFRLLIKDGQWIKPKEELWEQYGVMLVERLWDTYKIEGRSSAASFGRSKSTWNTLTNTIAMQFVQI
ncbi:abortive phage infection protein [Leptolyngbya sp. 'hensonii']|uniref:AIPR family protein n=1 Tax=Leptolyngbya sp. 'hensonii' TaxID=1922337 RepID=UPI00094FD3A1|nr:AIPR family protein [Leptolyngbya sp. 'hensonii']OLP18361.1 abortive phage infection protein [Leptolyngbya sp. 'hensonii']